MMRKRVLVSGAVVLACIGLVVLGTLIARNVGRPDSPPDPKVVSETNRFALRLFLEIADGRRNVCVSPSSIATALHMAYNGAGGSTRRAMADALGIGAVSLPQLNQSSYALRWGMERADAEVKIVVADSVWVREGIPLRREFADRMGRHYRAKVSELDFDSPQAPAVINSWVKRKTRGRIEGIVDRITPDIALYLIDTCYFRGRWSEPFEADLTMDEPFHLLKDGTRTVRMMHQGGSFLYYREQGFQAVSLPYGNRRLNMHVFLPDDRLGLSGFLKKLNPGNWEKWISGSEYKDGDIGLPRFTMEYKTGLNDALTALGMGIAFGSEADFGEMVSGGGVWIGEALHKTFIQVNEEGTEAAAVTSLPAPGAVPMQEPERFSMICDHPFFFAIGDGETGTILFMGTVVDPR